ncbi:hypothetical protein BH09DEP1_BH09DEP1_3150 [soil metagenome]
MKKLIILSLISLSSLCSAVAPVILPQPVLKTVRAINSTRNAIARTATAAKETAYEFGTEIKDIAQEVGQQFKEVGTDIYEAVITPTVNKTRNATQAAKDTTQEVRSQITTATRNTYNKAANSQVVTTTKEMASEIKDQLAEITQETYENALRTPAITVSEKAAAIATAIKEKIIAAKNATAQAATDAKNSEFGQDMADVGTQFKEAAVGTKDFVKEKSSRVWNKTLGTVQAIREELAN